jgi:hypothetical protein
MPAEKKCQIEYIGCNSSIDNGSIDDGAIAASGLY